MSCGCELQIELINPQEWYNANLQRLLENEHVREKQEQARQEAEAGRQGYYENFKDAIERGDYNSATYTPHLQGSDNALVVSYTNDKGYENPEPVTIGISATVDRTVGIPSVAVDVNDTDVTLAFSGLKGESDLQFLNDEQFLSEVMGDAGV